MKLPRLEILLHLLKTINLRFLFHKHVKPHSRLLKPLFDQVLLKLGERMEVREVDLARMMQLVEECSKEGTRDGEEEPDDAEGGVFGLGLLTVKRGIMPGCEVKIFQI